MINGSVCFESFGIFTRFNYGASDVTKNKKTNKLQRMAGFVPKESSNG
jgi:hypothetical protein